MYELKQICGNSYYISAPTNMGLYLTEDGEAVIIDTGIDAASAEGAYSVLTSLGRPLKMIISTHANSDHIGGNKRLTELTGAKVYAPELERTFMVDQHLNTALVWGGYPIPDLFNKFFFAPETEVTPLTSDILPRRLHTVELPGHYVSMIGIATEDGVLYAADALSGARVLERSHITYIHDVGKYLVTLDKLEGGSYKYILPSHGELTDDPAALCRLNRENVAAVCETIISVIREAPKSVDDIVAELFAVYGLRSVLNQYALVISTLRSYLGYLCAEGRVGYELAEGRMLWRAV